ncbi:serine/threonine-protein kinase [Streptomyces spirodelae]|uniref:serine/threonine-protein kinase n=1 Tax=Streptomyces spirodelae TaxID=2812904 RepID=UPI0027DB8F0B|nr:protein kinase [Streptomyces spirodelae]
MPSPDQIGRYRVERRLGSGAFAVVWLAHDDRLEAPVAVKVMADNWAHRMDIRERFLAEARLLRKASSGGVVQVFDVGEMDDERPYFVMEYADRGTVADRMVAGPLPVDEAVRLAAEAARGVEALHEAGVVHRDVKPSNVLLTSGGAQGRERVLVADLGLAKNLAHASGLTVVAGSVGYMAPEQAEPFEGIDARADIYSLGAVLYHLVTGAQPGNPDRVMPLDELRPGLPPAVAEAVGRAMEPDRERRWPTAAAFANELDRIANELDRDGWEEQEKQEEQEEDDSLAPSAAQLSSLTVGPASRRAASQPPTVATEPPSVGSRASGASGVSVVSGGPGSETSGASVASEKSDRDEESDKFEESGRTEESVGPETAAASGGGVASEGAVPEESVADTSGPRASEHERSAPGEPVLEAYAPGASGARAPSWDADSPPSVAGRPPRPRRRWRAVALGAAIVVLAGAGAAGKLLLPKSDKGPSHVRVQDASGRISLRLPAQWAQEKADSGWSPSSLGLSAEHAPGLVVSQDMKRWQDLTSGTSGVFVGLGYSSKDDDGATAAAEALPAKVAELKHKRCQYAGSRTYKGDSWQGRIRTWSACDSPGHSLEEIALAPRQKGKPPVYVQIRCAEDCSARTDQVLSSLRVSAS